MSRPSSLFPIVKNFTRGEESASACKYAADFSEFTSSPGAPMILPKNISGEGTLLEMGIEATHGDRNRASVVAFAIASVVPGSGTSVDVSVFCATATCTKKKNRIATEYFIPFSTRLSRKFRRVEFTISRKTRQPAQFLEPSNCTFGNFSNSVFDLFLS